MNVNLGPHSPSLLCIETPRIRSVSSRTCTYLPNYTWYCTKHHGQILTPVCSCPLVQHADKTYLLLLYININLNRKEPFSFNIFNENYIHKKDFLYLFNFLLIVIVILALFLNKLSKSTFLHINISQIRKTDTVS